MGVSEEVMPENVGYVARRVTMHGTAISNWTTQALRAELPHKGVDTEPNRDGCIANGQPKQDISSSGEEWGQTATQKWKSLWISEGRRRQEGRTSPTKNRIFEGPPVCIGNW